MPNCCRRLATAAAALRMLGVQGQRARGLSAAAGRFVVCIDGERLLAVEDGAICVHFAELCLMSVELAAGAPHCCGAEQPRCPGLADAAGALGDDQAAVLN